MIDIVALRAAADAEAEKGPTAAVARRYLGKIADELTVGREAIAALALLEQQKQAA